MGSCRDETEAVLSLRHNYFYGSGTALVAGLISQTEVTDTETNGNLQASVYLSRSMR